MRVPRLTNIGDVLCIHSGYVGVISFLVLTSVMDSRTSFRSEGRGRVWVS